MKDDPASRMTLVRQVASHLRTGGAALTFPWEFYFPAGLLVVLVLAINLVGDGLRDAFDPNTQGRA